MNFEQQQQEEEEAGHCHAPFSLVFKSNDQHYLKDIDIACNVHATDKWEHASKEQEGHHNVPCPYKSGVSIVLDPTYQQYVEEIAIAWDAHTDKWEHAFTFLMRFKQREGHCNVPGGHKEDEVHLGDWLYHQKRCKQKGKLKLNYLQRLNDVGVTWTQDEQWQKKYLLLEEFKEREGHCNVMRNHKENGVNLGTWLLYQKRKRKKGNLDPIYQRRLKDIGAYDTLK